MDKLRCMEAFVRTVEGGSFTAAADKLDISQQMVAKQVASLESHLGARLLNRTTRKQSLTEVGKQYYDRCKLILQQIMEADKLSQELLQEPRGVIRISAPKTFGSYSLAPFLTQFLQRYPMIEIELHLCDEYVDLFEGEYEAVFRIGHLEDSSLIARRLPDYQLVACASPEYLKRRGEPARPEELTCHECLGYIAPLSASCNVWHFYGDNQSVHRVPVSSRLKINESRALLSAVLSGFGIAMAPETMIRNELANGRLVGVLPGFRGPSRPLHLLYTQDRYRGAGLKLFINEVMQFYSAD